MLNHCPNMPLMNQQYPHATSDSAMAPDSASLSQFPAGRTLFCRTDLAGNIEIANDALAALTGYTPDEMKGRSLDMLLHQDMPRPVMDNLWNAVRAGHPARTLIKNRRKDQAVVWSKALLTPIRDHQRIAGYLLIYTAPLAGEVAEAEICYRDLRAKRKSLHSPSILMEMLFRLPFNLRYTGFVAMMVALTVGAGAAGAMGWTEWAVALACTNVGLAITSIVFVTQTVSRPLHQMLDHFEQIAHGNLDQDIDLSGRDEAGRLLGALASTQAQLRVIIDEIRGSVGILETRSADLETEVEQLLKQSQLQGDSIQQLNGAMENVSASASAVARDAAGAASAAEATLKIVGEGNQRVADNLQTTERIGEAVQLSSDRINRLSESTKRVGTVSRAIRDIAEQINLVALNASIEAARAGEQGRAFAVVADEVRSLADRTTRSTEDIETTLAEIGLTTQSAVDSMQHVAASVREGRALVDVTRDSFKKIIEASTQVTTLSSQIAVAAQEQSSASGKVARNSEDMSRLVWQNMESVQHVEKAVAGMRGTADQLESLVKHFKA